MKGWIDPSRFIRKPVPRPLTCGRMRTPASLALVSSSRISIQMRGLRDPCDISGLNVMPGRASTSRIHSESSMKPPASSKTPPPASSMPCAIAASSGYFANVPGINSPSFVRCTIAREVEKPSAPASIPSRTSRLMCASSSSFGSTSSAPRSPIT